MAIFWTKILEQTNSIQVKSVVDVLFKLCVVFFAFSFASNFLKLENWMSIMFAIIGCFVLLVAFGAYFYFAINKSEFLRSESFQLANKSIQTIGDKENANNPNIKELKYLNNPISLKEKTELPPNEL